MFRSIVCVAAAVLTAACAAHRPIEVRPGVKPGARHMPHADSMETAIDKALATQAHASGVGAASVESTDPALSAALLAARALETADSHGAVAAAYARLGILDKAYEHLAIAVKIDPADAAAWDAMARIWRDWGTPHLGLPDAYRAVYFAPSSPVMHNTLGTILDALGQHAEARDQYRQTVQLDASAAYAVSNACYSWFLEGRAPEAIDACRHAIAIQPALAAAHNNLGLVYAALGNLAAAQHEFAASGDRGRAEFNIGIVQMARRDYRDAVAAFERAQQLRPGFDAAMVMAHAARTKVAEGNAP